MNMNMDNFLKENGLEHAIPFFTCECANFNWLLSRSYCVKLLFIDHKMEMKFLNELTEDHIEELLPTIGDRIKFKEGLQVNKLK